MSIYHKLVEGIGVAAPETSYLRLLDKFEAAGYTVQWHNRDLLTDEDLEEAWNLLEQDGAEAAVDYLETMFGFLFVER